MLAVKLFDGYEKEMKCLNNKFKNETDYVNSLDIFLTFLISDKIKFNIFNSICKYESI